MMTKSEIILSVVVQLIAFCVSHPLFHESALSKQSSEKNIQQTNQPVSLFLKGSNIQNSKTNNKVAKENHHFVTQNIVQRPKEPQKRPSTKLELPSFLKRSFSDFDKILKNDELIQANRPKSFNSFLKFDSNVKSNGIEISNLNNKINNNQSFKSKVSTTRPFFQSIPHLFKQPTLINKEKQVLLIDDIKNQPTENNYHNINNQQTISSSFKNDPNEFISNLPEEITASNLNDVSSSERLFIGNYPENINELSQLFYNIKLGQPLLNVDNQNVNGVTTIPGNKIHHPKISESSSIATPYFTITQNHQPNILNPANRANQNSATNFNHFFPSPNHELESYVMRLEPEVALPNISLPPRDNTDLLVDNSVISNLEKITTPTNGNFFNNALSNNQFSNEHTVNAKLQFDEPHINEISLQNQLSNSHQTFPSFSSNQAIQTIQFLKNDILQNTPNHVSISQPNFNNLRQSFFGRSLNPKPNLLNPQGRSLNDFDVPLQLPQSNSFEPGILESGFIPSNYYGTIVYQQ